MIRAPIAAQVRNIYPSMSVPREYYDDGCDTGFLDDRAGNMINPRVGHPLYLQALGHHSTLSRLVPKAQRKAT